MPNFDLHRAMRDACERERERLVKPSALDWNLVLRQNLDRRERNLEALEGAVADMVATRSSERSGSRQATLTWVRASCERDGYPAWLVALVIARVQRELLAGDFPLVQAMDRPLLPPPHLRDDLFGNPALQEYVEHARLVLPPDPDALIQRTSEDVPFLAIAGQVVYAVLLLATLTLFLLFLLFLLSHLSVR